MTTPPSPLLRLTERLGLLSVLYYSQGLPFAFLTQALPALMRERGVDLRAIGLATLLGIPWGLKFLWAPWIDPLPRRLVLLPLQAITVVLLAAIAFLEPVAAASLAPVLVLCLAVNLVSATQDIAADGLAVGMLAPGERGAGNAVQVGVHRMGMIVGGGLLLRTWGVLGWSGTFLTMAGMIALASLPLLVWRPPPRIAGAFAPRIRLGDWLSRPGALAWLGLLVACKAGDALASGMLRPFLQDLKMPIEEVGDMLGILGFSTGLAGALTGGVLADRFGRRRTLLLATALEAAALALFVLPAAGYPQSWLWPIAGIESFTTGIVTAAVFTVMMDVCRPGQGATDFTVPASALAIGPGIFGALSGFVAKGLGYPAHFMLASALAFAGVAYLIAYRGRPPFRLDAPVE